MKAIVFGGSGFLGSHVADSLTQAGYDVTIFDLNYSKYLLSQQKMIIGNILDKDQVRNCVANCDIVYDFAGFADLDDASTKPIDTIRLNVEGTVNILEACRDSKVKRFLYASTIYVYSNKGGFYRCSKQAAELYIEEFQERYNLDFTILRYGTLYGPRANTKNSIYRYLNAALINKQIIIAGDGEELREYIHVRDAAELTVKVIADDFKNKHLIITGHHPIKLKQLMETIREMLNNSIDLIYEQGGNPAHYFITPYSYVPKIGKKITNSYYCDIGQGLLECLYEMDLRDISDE